MAISLVCAECHTRWPNSSAFATCPECDVATKALSVAKVLTPGEARSRVRGIQFIRFCAERDRKRELAGRPSPEELGRAEAAEITRQLREIQGLPDV